MDGLARVSGAPTYLDIDGVRYEISPLAVRDFGAIEQRLLQVRKQRFLDSLEGLSDEDRRFLLEKWYSDLKTGNSISPSEVSRWIDSVEGTAFSVWLCIRKGHPDVSLKTVEDYLEREGDKALAKLQQLRDQATGTDELGNGIGREEPATEPQARSNGDESTVSSAASTDGHQSK